MGRERRFEFIEGTSKKFWAVSVDGTKVTVRFGRIGSEGQSKTQAFPSAAAARQDADALIREKLGKGYAENASTASAAAAPPPLPQAGRYSAKPRWSVPFKRSQVQCLAFTPGAQAVVAAGFRAVGKFDADSGEVLESFELKEPVGDSWAAALSPDGARLLIGLVGAPIHVVDLASRKTVCRLQGNKESRGLWIQYLPDGRRIVGAKENSKYKDGEIVDEKVVVRIWNAESGRLEHEWSFPGVHRGFRVTEKGFGVMQTAKDTARLLAVESGKEILRIPGASTGGISISPDLKWALIHGTTRTASPSIIGSPTLDVWDVEKEKKILALKPKGAQATVFFRSAGRWWTGAEGVTLPGVGTLKTGRGAVELFSEDGRTLASTSTKASRDSVRLLEVAAI